MLFIAACATILLGCVNEPTFSLVPRIEFRSISKTEMNQATASFADSTRTTIYFEDGDGDIGGDSLSVFVLDTRTGGDAVSFRVKSIPIEGVSNAISGTISFPIDASCCIYDTGQIPCTPSNPVITQELVYDIYIKDRAGNQSNIVTLPAITLSCQ